MEFLFATPAYAQAAPAPAPGLDLVSMLIMMGAFGGIFYFLVFRPQQRRMKEHQDMLNNLRRGDEVITAGGFIAKVSRVLEGEDHIEIELCDGVRTRMLKSSISIVNAKPQPAKAESGAKPARAGAKPAAKAKKEESKSKPETDKSVDDASEDEKPADSEAETAAEAKAEEVKA